MKTLQGLLAAAIIIAFTSCSKKNDPAPSFDITSATQSLVKVNGCQNGNSLFELNLFYNSSRDLRKYYVELKVNYLFSNGQNGTYTDDLAEFDGRKLTTQSCTGFGGNSHIDLTITTLLFEKDAAGNKVGNPVATANPVTLRLGKPAGSN